MKTTAKSHPRLFALYFFLRLFVVVVMIEQLFNHEYTNVFLCFLTLILFTIPTFVERRIKVDVPDTLEVIILLFIFAAEILGEIREYYVNVPGWDTMLHTINGFLCAAIGIALIDILNRNDRFSISMSPLFVAVVAFCFSMTIGVLWEFIEFFSDQLFRTDMQKDAIVHSISSVMLNPNGRNIPVILNGITGSIITASSNGQTTQTTINGFLDLGLLDTMKDLFVNFIGAVVFSVIGYFYIKYRKAGKNSKFVSRFMLTRILASEADPAPPETASPGAGDDKERP
ncbi:hypothetical protein [Sporobacter termitidis]|nr:hypothetical protein [Sporobacter termitidis]